MSGFWLIQGLLLFVAMGIIMLPLWRSYAGMRSKQIASSLVAGGSVVLLAAGLYVHLGAATAVARARDMAQVTPAMIETMRNHPEQLVSQLQQILNDQPNSARGWYLLGKLYLDLGEYEKARGALEHAVKLKPLPEVQLALAQALFFTQKNQLNPTAEKLVQAVLKQQPEQPDAINLLAMNEFSRGHYPAAIKYWEQLLARVSPDSDTGKALLAAIAKARKQAT